jgi:hypothetical protein
MVEADCARLSVGLAAPSMDSATWRRRDVTNGIPQRVRDPRVVHGVPRYNYPYGLGSGCIRGGLRYRMGHAGVSIMPARLNWRFFDALETCIREGALDLAQRTLQSELEGTPIWRVFRRRHLARQLRVVSMCMLAVEARDIQRDLWRARPQ